MQGRGALRLIAPASSNSIISSISTNLPVPLLCHRQLHTLPVPPASSHLPHLATSSRRDVDQSAKPPLSILPFRALLRSFAITSISSSSFLLAPSLRVLSYLAHSSSPFLDLERNRFLHFCLKKTFYLQYCAGESEQEVNATVRGLKSLGFHGSILAYGKEIVVPKGEKLELATQYHVEKTEERKRAAIRDIEYWKAGTLKTIELTGQGEFVALKFSGAGKEVVRQLATGEEMSDPMEKATTEICDFAKEKGVQLLFDAEQDLIQRKIDAWTTQYQRRYNKENAVVFGTYQTYLKSMPHLLAQHLVTAHREGFVLGVKLVRGAYMASDPRNKFWDSKQDTDIAFDGITEALLKRQWNDVLQDPQLSSDFPKVAFVLATHNQNSVRKALGLQGRQTSEQSSMTKTSYAQLMGMADELSCELVLAGKRSPDGILNKTPGHAGSKVYKYIVWGSVGDCLKYLVRRAEENRDAVLRAKDTRAALARELMRRLKFWTDS